MFDDIMSDRDSTIRQDWSNSVSPRAGRTAYSTAPPKIRTLLPYSTRSLPVQYLRLSSTCFFDVVLILHWFVAMFCQVGWKTSFSSFPRSDHFPLGGILKGLLLIDCEC